MFGEGYHTIEDFLIFFFFTVCACNKARPFILYSFIHFPYRLVPALTGLWGSAGACPSCHRAKAGTHTGLIKCKILFTKQNTFKTQTQLLSCPKRADIAIRQAPAAANYKQIWCWVTKIPWPHGGMMRKVSNSPSFFRFSPHWNELILPLASIPETNRSVLNEPNFPHVRPAKFVSGLQPLGCIKLSESAHLLPGHVDIYSSVEYRLWWHVKV